MDGKYRQHEAQAREKNKKKNDLFNYVELKTTLVPGYVFFNRNVFYAGFVFI